MPPKKKGGKKKGKKGGEEKKEDVPKPSEPAEPSDREIYLRKEMTHLTNDLENLKKQAHDLRMENDKLQEEAQHTRIESHEYMTYMAKKTHKRQTTIISLSDQNRKELEKINSQKEQMLSEYEEKKNKLKVSLLEKESLLTKARREFQDLGEYRELRDDQLKKIKTLEREVLHMRGKHSEAIQQLKAKFLQEKADYTQESEDKIQALALEANKKAVQCLSEHTTNIKQENRHLRVELLALIHRSQVLNEHKRELEEQKKQLLREQQYSEDIRRLRGVRQKKAIQQLEREQRQFEQNA